MTWQYTQLDLSYPFHSPSLKVRGQGLGQLTFASLNGFNTFGLRLFAFLQKSLNRLTLLKAIEAIHNSYTLENLLNRFSWQSAILHPVIRAVFLDMDCRGMRAGVIETKNFQKATIAW